MFQIINEINRDFLKSNVILKIFPVLHGDCISINFKGKDKVRHNVIIDGGFQATYSNTLKKEAKRIKDEGEKIDLLIITHTDRDHIGGIIKLIEDYGDSGLIKKVWYNFSSGDITVKSSNMISINDGLKLRDKLNKHGLLEDISITNDLRKINIDEAFISVISPGRRELSRVLKKFEETEQQKEMISLKDPDYKYEIEDLVKNKFSEGEQLYNASSIGILIELWGTKILLLSDCIPSVIINWLKERGFTKNNKLKVDYMSVPHHGSRRNLNDELISLIDCENFLISANGMNRYNLPHKESLARIVKNSLSNTGIKFHFNYDNEVLRSIFTNQEMEDYNISCFFGNHSKNGIKITF